MLNSLCYFATRRWEDDRLGAGAPRGRAAGAALGAGDITIAHRPQSVYRLVPEALARAPHHSLLDVRARSVNDEMKLAAMHALAGIVADSEVSEERITPSMFDPQVVPTAAERVAVALRRRR